MAIKDYVSTIGQVVELVIMIPFIPIVLGLLLYFGWVLSLHRKIPEYPQFVYNM